MSSVVLNSNNYDSFVKATLIDGSILSPTIDPTPVGLKFLQPFFSGKGRDNVIIRETGLGTFEQEFGSDLDSVKVYGHGGILAREVINGGGIVDVCRLMPSDAEYASAILTVFVSEVVSLTSGGSTVNGKKVIVKTVPYDYTKTHDQNFGVTTVTIATVEYTAYPLIALKALGRGKYGNDIGFRIYPDTSRSGVKTGDGRRYILDLYEIQSSGALQKLGDSYEVVSSSFNQKAVTVAGGSASDSFDTVFSSYATKYKVPLTQEYSGDNYDAIVAELAPYTGTENSAMVDFLCGFNLAGQAYSQIHIDKTSTGAIDCTSSTINYLTGGSDGDVFDNTPVTLTDPVTAAVTHTTKSAITQKQLLINFYQGKIDDNIFDCRIIDSGITLDAWWPSEVKSAMTGYFGDQVRSDIAVIVDLGPEIYNLTDAQAAAADVAGNVSCPYGNVAINIHNGRTTNRSRNIRTTGNYEIASALPSLYAVQGPFTILAGWVCGRVRNMSFDFLPKIVKGNLQIQPLIDKNLLFAMRLDRSINSFWMSDSSQYVTQFSVLGSFRNLVFAGEVIRTVHKILVKYSFYPGDAPAAIPAATGDLKSTFSGPFFPNNIPITFQIFQTRNDKINGSASVALGIQFPDVIKSWNTTITVNRTPIK